MNQALLLLAVFLFSTRLLSAHSLEMAQPVGLIEDGGEVQFLSDTALRSAEWSEPGLLQPELLADESDPLWDELVEPTQFGIGAAIAGPARLGTRSQLQSNTRSRRRRRTSASAGLGLASIPFMIGDTGAGTCVAFGGLLQYEISHPSLTCSRLNISENNTPVPTDRMYYSIRHFHNSAGVSNYQFEREFNTDRYTIGLEKTFFGGMASLELRAPFEHRLTSDFFSVNAIGFGIDLVAADEEKRLEVANTSLIFKLLLMERRKFAISAGLGVTGPTAEDVKARLAVDTLVFFPDFPEIIQSTLSTYEMEFINETVYLSPFLSWVYAPNDRWFHQGFLQIEVAANPSTVYVEGLSVNSFFVNGVFDSFYDFEVDPPAAVDLYAQTLMRLNLGLGYICIDRPDTRCGLRVTTMAELHYTTTLQDANLQEVPLTVTASGGLPPLQAIVLGNLDNRVDILNAAAGLSVDLGDWTINNGVVAPLREAPDRGFDFEYNFQLQRVF